MANATAPAPLAPRTVIPKLSYEDLVKKQPDEFAIIKFAEGTGIRLRDAVLKTLESLRDSRRAERSGVTGSKLEMQIRKVNDLLQTSGTAIERVFLAAEDVIQAQQLTGEALDRRELADLNLFYQIAFPKKSAQFILEVLDQLNQLEIVEYVGPKIRVAPPPSDIPPTTPYYGPNYQRYFQAAPDGIDVPYARLLPGGRGEGIRVVDVEDGWIADHEDFPSLVSSSGNNYAQFRDHGTAVIGEIAAIENDYGMTGIAPSAEISIASPVVPPNNSFNLPDAIQRAVSQSRIGDIILVEQSVYYNANANDLSYCPPEWDVAVFAAAQNAVANGRVVIETAGNSGQNLDDAARFGTRFDRSIEDSGAIYVGAGAFYSHDALSLSNYGSRLDVQGEGQLVATLGYGETPCQPPSNCLFFPNNDARQSYTSGFSGTSAAAPVVTGAAAIIQAVRRARGLPNLTSPEMRTALLVGATPQGSGGHVGPLPDLRDALAAIPLPAPAISASGHANGSATVSWAAVSGVAGYEVSRKDSHGGPWNFVTTTSNTSVTDNGSAPAKTYLYRVQAYDAAGSYSVDSNYDTATTVTYTDPQITSPTLIRALHVIEVRSAVNAMCVYSGASNCPSLPFTGDSLVEVSVKGDVVTANDFVAAKNHIVSLRSAIGAAPATFGETPSIALTIRVLHMLDLRGGAN